MPQIMITGSHGLIGSALASRLALLGWQVVSFDIKEPAESRDILQPDVVTEAMRGCDGVVHLAAVSRVIWGEADPVRCREVNIQGTRNILQAAQSAGQPWVLAASSREVYGQASSFPVPESAPRQPLNTYARSKAEAEDLVSASRASGLRASVIRFSSVYGSVHDHPDRVAPAFAHAAAAGQALRVDGAKTTLDFTHIDDVTDALQIAVERLTTRDATLPTLHLVSGRGTALTELAEIAIRAAGRGEVRLAAGRPYDVTSFVGDPARAAAELGWQPRITLEAGMAALISQFRALSDR